MSNELLLNASRSRARTWLRTVAPRIASHAGLTWVLAVKNFQVRYKRATIGVLWAIIQPAFQAAFLSFVFIKLFRIAQIPHYPLYVLSGMLPWAFFGQSVLAATTAVVDNAGLVRKIAIPLSIFPIAAIGGTAIAFSASLIVLVGAAAVAGVLQWRVLLLPTAFALEAVFLVGTALLTGAFHVAFRDIRYAIESVLLVGLYATPILYDLERVPDALQPYVRANPMTGVISIARYATLGRPLDLAAVYSAVAASALLLIAGAIIFRRRSPEFPDLV